MAAWCQQLWRRPICRAKPTFSWKYNIPLVFPAFSGCLERSGLGSDADSINFSTTLGLNTASMGSNISCYNVSMPYRTPSEEYFLWVTDAESHCFLICPYSGGHYSSLSFTQLLCVSWPNNFGLFLGLRESFQVVDTNFLKYLRTVCRV